MEQRLDYLPVQKQKGATNQKAERMEVRTRSLLYTNLQLADIPYLELRCRAKSSLLHHTFQRVFHLWKGLLSAMKILPAGDQSAAGFCI